MFDVQRIAGGEAEGYAELHRSARGLFAAERERLGNAENFAPLLQWLRLCGDVDAAALARVLGVLQ